MEFLFRGKTLNHKWIESASVWFSYGVPNLFIDGYWIPVLPVTLTQYVNQTDREGNKVFDGDILEFEYDGEKFLHEVCWSEKFSAFLLRDAGFFAGECIDFLKECVVVGNRFDNPELLIAPKGEK